MWYQRLPILLAGLALLVASAVAGHYLTHNDQVYEAGYYTGYSAGYRDGQVQEQAGLAPVEPYIPVGVRAEGDTLQMDIGPYRIYVTPGVSPELHSESVEQIIVHQGTCIEVTRR